MWTLGFRHSTQAAPGRHSAMRALRVGPALLLLALSLTACSAGAGSGRLHPTYRSHTHRGPLDAHGLLSLARSGAGLLREVKFIIQDFDQPERAKLLLLDGTFYRFHDEWYWYQLLNGANFRGDRGLRDGPGFSSPAQAAEFVRSAGLRGLDLSFVGERLYSSRFYNAALRAPRRFGLGSLIHLPEGPGGQPLWAFTLEYTDRIDAATLQRYRQVLQAQLARPIAASLKWVTRSPQQRQLASAITARDPHQRARILPYASLSTKGEVVLYNRGLTAGRLRLVKLGESIVRGTRPDDILVVAELPDDLPPCAGLLSMLPHTPLSHLNILARNRGIPSAYVAGLEDNAHLMQLARAHAPVLLSARGGRVRVAALTDAEYGRWLSSRTSSMHVLPRSDTAGLPYVHGLQSQTAPPSTALVGGKSAGMALLKALPQVQVPEPLLALTVRAYAEHLHFLDERLERLLSMVAFKLRRSQVLVLEGRPTYNRLFPLPSDGRIATALLKRHSLFRELVSAGGVKAMIRARPLADPLRRLLKTELTRHFGGLPSSQGLRFRSSSTMEDVEGFNGAGLYTSSTGFLRPSASSDKGVRKRSVDWALKRTWASYWNWQAYVEREQAGLDHLAGRMGVLVHPRFDDAHELANGVISYRLFPSSSAPFAALVSEMEVDVQPGALSVTNPDTGREVTPEVVRLFQRQPDAAIELSRVGRSSVVPDGEVMGDPALLHLFGQVKAVAERYLARDNEPLPPAQRGRLAELDLEFRIMAGAWPDGDPSRPERTVLKQVRSLSAPAPLPDLLALGLPIPKHLARSAVRLERLQCDREVGALEWFELTQPKPQGGAPFVPLLRLTRAGATHEWNHLQFSQPAPDGKVLFVAEAARAAGLSELHLARAGCTRQTELASRTDMLQRLLPRAIDLGTAP